MRRPASLLLCLLVLLTASTVRAQGSLDRRIALLQREIAQREGIDRDDKIPEVHKAINRPLLAERRRELLATIQERVADLQRDLGTRGSSMSQAERNHAQTALRTLLSSTSQMGAPAPLSATRPRRTVGSSALANPGANGTSVRSGQPVVLTLARPASAAGAPAALPEPQTQVAVLRSPPTTLSNASVTHDTLDLPNAAIFNADDAAKIIEDAIRSNILVVPSRYYEPPTNPGERGVFSSDFYCVIHVLRWANPGSAQNSGKTETKAQTVATQNWYVFNSGKGKGAGRNRLWSNEDFAKINRIFGVRKVWLLYVHLNKAADYDYALARYDFNVEKKTAANVSDLLNVAQLFITDTSAKTLAEVDLLPTNLWGGGSVDINYVPSNITITASFVKTIDNGPVVALDKPQKFDNEGRYWWDVSVGVPIRHITQTQFDATAGTVTAKTVDKQNAFALLNLYPVPVDIKGTNYSWIPHFVGGVAIAKQPLKKILVGAGVGPHFANFYVGALFTEQTSPASLKEGDAATSAQLNADSHRHYKTQLSFGLNLPVRGIVESLKKTSK